MAEVAIQKNIKKIAILAENTDYAQAIKKVFISRFKGLGGTIISDTVNSQTTDLSPVTKIKSSHPEAIYLIPNSVITAEIAVRQIHELGLNIQLLSNEVVATGDFLKNLGSLLEGVLFAETVFDENKPTKAKNSLINIKKNTAHSGYPLCILPWLMMQCISSKK